MDNKDLTETELIPGTNIPRPRYREAHETDEEYVDYLRGYYANYFPDTVENLNTDNVEAITVPVAESDISATETNSIEPSDDELNTIQEGLENFADTVEKESINFPIDVEDKNKDENDLVQFNLETQNEDENNIQNSIDLPIDATDSQEEAIDFDLSATVEDKNDEDSIQFDLDAIEEDEEIESFSEVKPSLIEKIRTNKFFIAVKNFFAMAKQNANKVSTALYDYFNRDDNSLVDDFDAENSLSAGRAR